MQYKFAAFCSIASFEGDSLNTALIPMGIFLQILFLLQQNDWDKPLLSHEGLYIFFEYLKKGTW
jgi:hypothetical protein